MEAELVKSNTKKENRVEKIRNNKKEQKIFQSSNLKCYFYAFLRGIVVGYYCEKIKL